MDHVEGPLHILLMGNEGHSYLNGEEGNKSMMDHLERSGMILVALA